MERLAKSLRDPSWLQTEGHIILRILHPIKAVFLASKICPTKVVHLGCNEVHLIKAMSSAIKLLCREMHGANQILN